MGYVFVLPWLIGILGLVLYPLIQSFNFSLNNIRMIPGKRVMQFIGIDNYTRIFLKDPTFILDLKSYITEKHSHPEPPSILAASYNEVSIF